MVKWCTACVHLLTSASRYTALGSAPAAGEAVALSVAEFTGGCKSTCAVWGSLWRRRRNSVAVECIVTMASALSINSWYREPTISCNSVSFAEDAESAP